MLCRWARDGDAMAVLSQAGLFSRTQALTADQWIRRTTTASVLLLAGIAAVVSYGHMHTLAVEHSEGAWAWSWIAPNGMICVPPRVIGAPDFHSVVRWPRAAGGLRSWHEVRAAAAVRA
jgi:Protein of unknown function (DUF2637)